MSVRRGGSGLGNPGSGSTRLFLLAMLLSWLPGQLLATEAAAQGGGFSLQQDRIVTAALGGPFRLDRDVLAPGGPAVDDTGLLVLDQVLSEPVVGRQHGAGFTLIGGFLAPVAAGSALFSDGFESR